jgi:hypothetical protein
MEIELPKRTYSSKNISRADDVLAYLINYHLAGAVVLFIHAIAS